eukprot:TRINITY_DN2048_c3_g2_i1.p1 TRINITY_DN2048_c3_g2~~TRINITY_DN2048_c3_g2_i1.p1  ORF type:complete len:311 (+),score=59.55 TRINITY_DN2048_c3_g2_i1:334-1266(+)
MQNITSWGLANELGEEPVSGVGQPANTVEEAENTNQEEGESTKQEEENKDEKEASKQEKFHEASEEERRDEMARRAAHQEERQREEYRRGSRLAQYTKNQYNTYEEQLEDERQKFKNLEWPKTKEEVREPERQQRMYDSFIGSGEVKHHHVQRRERQERPATQDVIERITEDMGKMDLKDNMGGSGILEVFDIKGEEVREEHILSCLGIERTDLDKVRWLDSHFAYFHFSNTALSKISECAEVMNEDFKTRIWDPSAPTPTPRPAAPIAVQKSRSTVNTAAFSRLVTRCVNTNDKRRPVRSPTQPAQVQT